ncbi:hypothetical protein BpHYR1_048503 [Brachionus plicatilis]|uniref:Uncharacterized protein n=1 Tax=Brachionus plicatilis TaxID=10195 RepID=A0A3M7SCB0_BRAPC|nr:hypothetical protein BpHYR1_048503 [Brachionus plicatilis]
MIIDFHFPFEKPVLKFFKELTSHVFALLLFVKNQQDCSEQLAPSLQTRFLMSCVFFSCMKNFQNCGKLKKPNFKINHILTIRITSVDFLRIRGPGRSAGLRSSVQQKGLGFICKILKKDHTNTFEKKISNKLYKKSQLQDAKYVNKFLAIFQDINTHEMGEVERLIKIGKLNS